MSNGLDPDQDRRSVGPGLGQSLKKDMGCLERGSCMLLVICG